MCVQDDVLAWRRQAGKHAGGNLDLVGNTADIHKHQRVVQFNHAACDSTYHGGQY